MWWGQGSIVPTHSSTQRHRPGQEGPGAGLPESLGLNLVACWTAETPSPCGAAVQEHQETLPWQDAGYWYKSGCCRCHRHHLGRSLRPRKATASDSPSLLRIALHPWWRPCMLGGGAHSLPPAGQAAAAALPPCGALGLLAPPPLLHCSFCGLCCSFLWMKLPRGAGQDLSAKCRAQEAAVSAGSSPAGAAVLRPQGPPRETSFPEPPRPPGQHRKWPLRGGEGLWSGAGTLRCFFHRMRSAPVQLRSEHSHSSTCSAQRVLARTQLCTQAAEAYPASKW